MGTFEDKSKQWGIRENLNLKFVKDIQRLHRTEQPKHIINLTHGNLAAESGDHLFNPFLRLQG